MSVRVKLHKRNRPGGKDYQSKGILQVVRENVVASALILIALLLVASVVSAAFVHFFIGIDIPFLQFKHHDTAAYWGQLGDFVGGMLNPLLSFVALMAVVYSINLQRKDLLEVRRESNEANKIQNDQTAIYRRQGVEASLLGLIAIHSKIVDEMVVEFSDGDFSEGRKAITRLGELFAYRLRSEVPPKVINPAILRDAMAQAKYKSLPLDFYSAYSSYLSRYMRSVFQVMKFIDTRIDAFDYSEGDVASQKVKEFRRFRVSYAARREFSSIFRAQFDQHELRLIFLNCLTVDGGGLKYYVEKYSLLKGMHLNLLSNHQELIEKFDGSAFQDYEDLDLLSMFEMERSHVRDQVRKAFQRGPSKKVVASAGGK